MLKVKIFDEEHEADLEEKVNEFLESISETQIKDIQFQVATADDSQGMDTVFCFSAMVVYAES